MPYPQRMLPVRRRRLSGYVTSAAPTQPVIAAGPNPAIVQSPASPNPLDYVSPQSAVAAGLDPNLVNAAWSKQVNQFPSAAAAVNAGVPPTVVTDLWQGGTPPDVPFWQKYPILTLAGAGVLALALFGGKAAD